MLHCLLIFNTPLDTLKGQAACVLKPPIFKIDFGNGITPVEQNRSRMPNHQQVYDHCPRDGHYAIVASTRDCFHKHWITLNQDHTPNDREGKMLLVNASYNQGLFFVTELTGLSPGTTYELAVWLVNVCWAAIHCTPIRPNLRFTVENRAGKELAKFSTGEIPQTGNSSWMQYSAYFKTPTEAGTLLLKIENKEDGGCGNDFAMDDITIRECVVKPPIQKVMTPPIKKEAPQPATKPVGNQLLPTTQPVAKQKAPVLKPVQQVARTITKGPEKDTLLIKRPALKPRPLFTPALPPFLSRISPIIRHIETGKTELVIDLYDNGEIDGDTVSIFHNNEMIVSRAALSAKAITFRIPVDGMHPHHELVMVANNLGSIPPNTSLMIVTSKDKRYEVFISSSEQNNAKVVIDLKE